VRRGRGELARQRTLASARPPTAVRSFPLPPPAVALTLTLLAYSSSPALLTVRANLSIISASQHKNYLDAEYSYSCTNYQINPYQMLCVQAYILTMPPQLLTEPSRSLIVDRWRAGCRTTLNTEQLRPQLR